MKAASMLAMWERDRAYWRKRQEEFRARVAAHVPDGPANPLKRGRPLSEQGPHLGFHSQPICGQPAGAASIHYIEGECDACLVELDDMVAMGMLEVSPVGVLLDLTRPALGPALPKARRA